MTVSVAVLVTDSRDAVIVTDAWAVTFLWLTVNVAVDLPAATAIVAGQPAADVSELLSFTTSPPMGAGPVRVTVPVT